MSTRKVECKAHAFRPGEASSYALSEAGDIYVWNPASIADAGFWAKSKLDRKFWPMITESMKIRCFSFDIEVVE